MTYLRAHWSQLVRDCEVQGRAYVIVTVLAARGSTPRDSGTKMIVTVDGFGGTIGGGTLEYSALETARALLLEGRITQRVENYPLGEKLGQCCGGSTSLLFECFVPDIKPLYLFGAGHVGRALVPLLCTLPFTVHWVDARREEFPSVLPDGVTMHCSENPTDILRGASSHSYYLIMTHQHPLDFDLLETALSRGDSAYIGVIGSASKWRRFRLRLAHREFAESLIDTVHCPIGLRSVPGKQPAEIAVSIAAQLIAHYHAQHVPESPGAGPRWKDLRDQLRNTGVTVSTSISNSEK